DHGPSPKPGLSAVRRFGRGPRREGRQATRGIATGAGVRRGHARRALVARMEIVRREQRESFITADGSSIRELAGIPSGNSANQSLAAATVPPGGTTIAHLHRRSEEIYLFTDGSGRMRLGDGERPVCAGD